MCKTVLAVDDSPSIRQAVNITLSSAGFNVIEATDGQAALDQMKGNQIDLMITDYSMPLMNGIELTKRVRKKNKTRFMPILMLTTDSKAERKLEGKQAGVTGWIVKPFNPNRLESVVNMLLKD